MGYQFMTNTISNFIPIHIQVRKIQYPIKTNTMCTIDKYNIENFLTLYVQYILKQAVNMWLLFLANYLKYMVPSKSISISHSSSNQL